MDLSSLKPFHGYQSSIIPLSGGHYIYLASWDMNPTQFPSFTNLWLVTPENKRILFSDPPASSEIVCIYHEFDEIFGATIDLRWISDHQLTIQCKSVDGEYEMDVTFHLRYPLATRLLVALGSGPPTRFRISKGMVAITNYFLNTLVARGGSAIIGETETGRPFYHGEAEKLLHIEGGSMSLNGEVIGTVSSPTWPVEFGDAVPYIRPVVKLGTLYIPFNENMIGDNE